MTWTDSGIMPELLRRFVVCEISQPLVGLENPQEMATKEENFRKPTLQMKSIILAALIEIVQLVKAFAIL